MICGLMRQEFKSYVKDRLPREDDRELFNTLLEAYERGGPDEVKKTIQIIVRNITEA